MGHQPIPLIRAFLPVTERQNRQTAQQQPRAEEAARGEAFAKKERGEQRRGQRLDECADARHRRRNRPQTGEVKRVGQRRWDETEVEHGQPRGGVGREVKAVGERERREQNGGSRE